MEEIFKQYGGPIITVVAIIAIVAIVGVLLTNNGVVQQQVSQLFNNFFNEASIGVNGSKFNQNVQQAILSFGWIR